MIDDEAFGGGGFAEVRDGETVEPIIRPPADESPTKEADY